MATTHATTSKPIKVLFLCTGNACRSQMAEGWARHLKGGVIDAYSAGVEPHGLNPLAVKVMAEAGVDISTHTSKHLSELSNVPFDYVVTVCDNANESCPVFPGKVKRLHVSFDDPPRLAKDATTDEERLPHYRRVRDEIRQFIERWQPGGTPLNKYAAEIFGTFTLVFAGTGAIVIDSVTAGGVSHVGVAITFGLVVMAMIYALGDVSGAHLNPAVTIGFWLARRLPSRCVGPYILAQILGAVCASALLRMMFSNQAFLGATLPAGPAVQSFVLETVLTAILMFVILCVATGPKEVGIVAGIAIGGVVGLEAMFAGPISGASMNPARSLAPALVSLHFQSLWVYLVAPLLGSAAAVPCWHLTRRR